MRVQEETMEERCTACIGRFKQIGINFLALDFDVISDHVHHMLSHFILHNASHVNHIENAGQRSYLRAMDRYKPSACDKIKTVVVYSHTLGLESR